MNRVRREPYRAFVYFRGPRTEWSGQLDPAETIHECASPWLWLARRLASQQLGNRDRCGYVIMQGGKVIERFPVESPVYGVA